MTPIRLSHTWYRRLYVTFFLIASIFAGLYIVEQASVFAVPSGLQIGLIEAATAGIVAIGSIVLFILVTKVQTTIPLLATYLLLTLVVASVTQHSGGVFSPFLAVWTVMVFLSAIFGAAGWLTVIALTGVYIGGIYLSGNLDATATVATLVSSLVPLIGGAILWRAGVVLEDTSTKKVKHLANQLSEVATTSEIVINAIGDGVIVVDGKGTIELINPAAQQTLGWGKQDAMALSYKTILKMTDESNNEIDVTADPIQQVLNTNQMARDNDLIAVSKSGKKLYISLVVSPIGDPGAGAIAVFRDITNERAEEREQAEFISTASHEMRTPVAAIEGYLGLTLNPATATIDQKARDFILKAHEAAQHLGRLFQDLLDVSKSEDGRMANAPKVVDMVSYSQNVTLGLTQKASDKGLHLIFKPTEATAQRKIMPVYYVNQDNDHIREIVDNLIENAIKYTPQGEVTVDVYGTEDKVVVSIKDTGLGIPPEDVSHLFQKFYRVDNADRQSIGGTGLGLYLSRRLAEAMQGRLWVESVFGTGSTFFLELPRIDNAEAEHLKEQQAKQSSAQAAAIPAFVPEPVDVAPELTPPPASPVQVVNAPAQTMQQPVVLPVTPISSAPIAPMTQAASAPQSGGFVRPATTVPRGASLTREQIAERVRQLEDMARQQRGGGDRS